MRVVLQRVGSARVSVDGRECARIGPGLVALVGVGRDDGPDDVRYIAGKIRNLRLFEDDGGRLNRSLADVGGELLVVSQFTLYGDCRRGRRPSFDKAAPPAGGLGKYEDQGARLRARGPQGRTGRVKGEMQVVLVNDGPVTLLIDSGRGF
ncbi:MAG: D-tyrosyl-tRNA(Tyr) deacylase [Acidobacteria bacterium]|nr:D-tyrosyl-tRNA(Tyr) deacylase [Acidobacteriota bacterium]